MTIAIGCRGIQLPFPNREEQVPAAESQESDPPTESAATEADGESVGGPADSPGGESALQSLISAAIAKNARRVRLPPGRHRINDSLRIEGAKDLTIDGTGAYIIQTNQDVQVFRLTQCKGVKLIGMTIDYDPLPFTQGRVIAASTDTFDVKLDDGYPTDLKRFTQAAPDEDQSVSAEIFDSKTRRMKLDGEIVFPDKVTSPRPGIFRLHHTCGSWCNFQVGDLTAIKSRGSPDSMAILIEESQDTVLDKVTIHAAAMTGIMEWFGDGGSRLNYRITRGPRPKGAKEDRLLSTNRDGYHNVGTRRGPTLDGVLTEFCSDDGVNIHTSYNTVGRIEGDRVILSTKAWMFTKPGDTVRFYDASTLQLRLEAQAKEAFEDGTGESWIRVPQAKLVQAGDLTINASRQGSNAVIKNSTFRDITGRGIILRGEGHRVENNTIERPTMSGIVLGAEIGYFQEGDFARNIIVRGNHLREIGLSKRSRDGATDQIGAISILTLSVSDKRDKIKHHYQQRNIKIIDNEIDSCGVAGILVADAADVKICGNRLTNTNAAEPLKANQAIPGAKADAAIVAFDAKNVVLAGNVVARGPYASKTVQSQMATVVDRATEPCN